MEYGARNFMLISMNMGDFINYEAIKGNDIRMVQRKDDSVFTQEPHHTIDTEIKCENYNIPPQKRIMETHQTKELAALQLW